MSDSYLNKTGLSYFWSKIKAWCNGLFALDSCVVHNTGDETVAGNKTFTSNAQVMKDLPSLFLRSTTIDTTVSRNTTIFTHLIDFCDLNGTEHKYRLGAIRTGMSSRDENFIQMIVYDPAADSENVISFNMYYPRNGTPYATLVTPDTADNSNKIATTAFVKAQGYLTSHQSLANYVTLNTNQNITGVKTIYDRGEKLRIKNPYIARGDAPSTTNYSTIAFYDNSATDSLATRFGIVENIVEQASGKVAMRIGAYKNVSGSTDLAVLDLWHWPDGTAFVSLPTPPASSNANTAATTEWVRTYGSNFVALTGDQTVAGTKTFTSSVYSNSAFLLKFASTTKGTNPSSWGCRDLTIFDKEIGTDSLVDVHAIGRLRTEINTNGTVVVSLYAYKFVHGSTDVAALKLVYPLSSYPYVTTPNTLILSKSTDAYGLSDNGPALIVGGTQSQAHLELDANEIMAKASGTATGDLYVNNDGGMTYFGPDGIQSGGRVTVHGNVSGCAFYYWARTLDKTVAPSANSTMDMTFGDVNGYAAGNFFARFGIRWQPNKTVVARIVAYKGGVHSDDAAEVGVAYPAAGDPYAFGPSTPSSPNSIALLTYDWIPKDTRIVHTTGDETISGVKTFINSVYGKTRFSAIHPSVSYNSNPSAAVSWGYIFDDKDLNHIGRCVCAKGTDGTTWLKFSVNKPGTTDWSAESYLTVVCTAAGLKYAQAPTANADSNSTTIATTNWVRTATGDTSLNAATATALKTARAFRVHLDSTSTDSFDGTANCTPGVSGVLGVSNGGTGLSSLSTFVRTTGTQTINTLNITANGNLSGTANTKAFYLCGGTGNTGAEGAYMILVGSTNTGGNAGSFFIRAATSTSNVKTLLGKANGSLTWDGQTIQTSSDERLKTPLSAVPDDVLDAWGDAEWGEFKYLEAVEEKGSGARLHLGLIAQRVDAAFAARGADACRYGILCHENRPASEEEPAVDLWTVRYAEALAMEAAYQRRENARLKKRVADLEERLAAFEAKLS